MDIVTIYIANCILLEFMKHYKPFYCISMYTLYHSHYIMSMHTRDDGSITQ